MNIDTMKLNSKTLEHQNWMLESGLNQHVKDFTRYRKLQLSDGTFRVDMSLIDHVYSNLPSVPVKIIPTEHSDHDIILITHALQAKVSKAKQKPKSRFF